MVQTDYDQLGAEHMNAGVSAKQTVREQNLLELKDFCLDLHESVAMRGLTANQEKKAWEAGISGCCTRCGEIVSGEELYLLGTLPEEAEMPGNVRRLRLGYCVKIGCEGWTVLLQFRQCPEFDWPQYFEERSQRAAGVKRHWFRMPSINVHPAYRRIAIGFAAVVLLLGVREWRIGGEIPFIREAQQFKVDVSPQADLHEATRITLSQQDD